MAAADGSRAVVILGMHRSGTSAVTRGLAALGVHLGEDLIGAQPDNPTGFWEDRSVLEVCERALELRGMSSVSVRFGPEPTALTDPLNALADEAVELLRGRFGAHPLWGFKNPRTARVLPFWQEVFRRLGAQDCYVIVCRNPLSVARSLEVRNGIAATKSHLLWLQHTVAALTHTAGRPRVVVDYDEFLNEPRHHLERIASALDLTTASKEQAIDEYASEFLVTGLRHTQFTLDDLDADPAAPGFLRTIYRHVRRAARDEIAVDSAELVGELAAVSGALEAMDPVFGFLEQREHEVFAAWNEVSAQRLRIDELQQALEAQTATADLAARMRVLELAVAAAPMEQIAAMSSRIQELAEALATVHAQASSAEALASSVQAALHETQGQLAAAQQALLDGAPHVAALEGQLAAVVDRVAQQDARAAAQAAQADALQAQVAHLTASYDRHQHQEATIHAQAAEIAALTARADGVEGETSRLTSRVHVLEDAHAFAREALSRQETQLASMAGVVEQRDAENAALMNALSAREAELQAMRRSFSWRVTTPLRAIRRGIRFTGPETPGAGAGAATVEADRPRS